MYEQYVFTLFHSYMFSWCGIYMYTCQCEHTCTNVMVYTVSQGDPASHLTTARGAPPAAITPTGCPTASSEVRLYTLGAMQLIMSNYSPYLY